MIKKDFPKEIIDYVKEHNPFYYEKSTLIYRGVYRDSEVYQFKTIPNKIIGMPPVYLLYKNGNIEHISEIKRIFEILDNLQ